LPVVRRAVSQSISREGVAALKKSWISQAVSARITTVSTLQNRPTSGETIMFQKHWIRFGFMAFVAAAIWIASTTRAADTGNEQKVALKDCPAAVQQTIKAKAGQAVILEITKDTAEGDVEFSVSIKTGNKERTLFVGEDGEDRGWEEKVTLPGCPVAVQKTIQEKTAKAAILKLLLEGDDQGNKYTAVVKKAGQDRAFSVATDGTFMGWVTEVVELKDCPAAVQKTIKEAAGGSTIKTIEDAVEDFAVDIIKDGKERTFYVTAAGKVREWEDVVELKDCPVAVQKTIKEKAGQAAITGISKLTAGANIRYAATTKRDGVERDFSVTADGKFLGWEDGGKE
jgi:hypothetical protein